MRATRRSRNSGRRIVLPLACSLALAVAAVLLILRLPALVEWWFVTAAWWLIWFLTIATLLYRGGPVRDDLQWQGPRPWFSGSKSAPSPQPKPNGGGADWVSPVFDGLRCGPIGEFFGMLVFVAIGAIAAVFLAWAVIEVLIPLALVLWLCTLARRG